MCERLSAGLAARAQLHAQLHVMLLLLCCAAISNDAPLAEYQGKRQAFGNVPTPPLRARCIIIVSHQR